MNKRTAVTMLQSGPGGLTFGVFRVLVRRRLVRGEMAEYWRTEDADHVATVVRQHGDSRPSYREMAEAHATPEWPVWERM
jgi:hypothetical protein